jgi:hypothetical protein
MLNHPRRDFKVERSLRRLSNTLAKDVALPPDICAFGDAFAIVPESIRRRSTLPTSTRRADRSYRSDSNRNEQEQTNSWSQS